MCRGALLRQFPQTKTYSFATGRGGWFPNAKERHCGAWRQTWVLVRRELHLLINDPWRELALPLVGMPVFFALVLALAVKRDEWPMLGFLSILSVIWMGASQSLMAIVKEREILDHERLLFLRLRAYLGAKLGTRYLLSAAQSTVFVVLLYLLRLLWGGNVGDDSFVSLRTFVVLVLTGWGATGAGLALSAVSGRRTATANLLFPLFMVLQIVFSLQIAGERRIDRVDDYLSFSMVPRSGDQAAKNPLAAGASYLTLSRWSDMALSCFSYSVPTTDADKESEYQRAYCEALAWLTGWIGGTAIVTAMTLQWGTAVARLFKLAKDRAYGRGA